MPETPITNFRQLPASFGPLKGANGHGQILGPCGDTMDFWVLIHEGRILDATFTTDGCSASISSGSMAAHMAVGRTPDEAARMTPKQVLEAVGGLPEDHQHCPLLAVNTLRAALNDYLARQAAYQGACDHDGGGDAPCAHQAGMPPRAPAPGAAPSLQSRMDSIRHKVLVLSGKGGVGKSTVAANLATALALAGHRVGLLDVDIHGPSIPKLLGLDGRRPTANGQSIQPVGHGPNLKVMSIGFLLNSPRDAVIWRGPMKYDVIQQFLRDVDWGDLDYLIIDAPPGTGDEPLTVAQLIGPAWAVVVTTPQDVAIADVRRSVEFCTKLSLRVLGIVENMSGFACPHCGRTTDLFKTGGGGDLATEMRVPFLGRIPLDPQVVVSGDAGTPFVERFAQSPCGLAFAEMVQPIRDRMNSETNQATNNSKNKGTTPMKIAIPLAGGRLAQHFGHCEQFALVEADPTTQKILSQTQVTPPPHEPGLLPRWLHEQGVQVIIAGAMGQRALDLFAQNGIQVKGGAANDTVENMVAALLDGKLTAGASACNHHGGCH